MIKSLFFFLAMALLPVRAADPWWPEPVAAALSHSAGNLAELTRALTEVPEAQRSGMGFLMENMPVVDLQSLKADFRLGHVARTYETMAGVPWSQQVPLDIFLNDILPYASLNEARDGGRQRMRAIAAPLVKDCQTPGEAAMVLNQKLFGTINVKYSTTRLKPDQSALEIMQSGLASPVGLRNVPFALQVGGNDAAYRRNEIAAEWGRKLDVLQQADPSGYPHFTEVHAGKGHWMAMADRKAVTLSERGDPRSVFSSAVTVTLP